MSLPGIEGGHILLLSQRDEKVRLQRPRAPSANTPYTHTVRVYSSLFVIDLKINSTDKIVKMQNIGAVGSFL